jgi:subtilisin family serine protease
LFSEIMSARGNTKRLTEISFLVGTLLLTAVPSRADRVIVALREPVLLAKGAMPRETAIAAAQARVLAGVPAADVVRWRNIPAFAAELSPEAIAKLREDADVIRVDADVSGTGGDAVSLPLIGGTVVHGMGYTGKGVTVAVVDSGIDGSHPDFAGRIVDEQCFCQNADGSGCCPGGSITQSGPGAAADDEGHGTNVTGILTSHGAVSFPGVAPEAKIVSVKVLDRNGVFQSTAQVISGLDWLISNHPEVRVINMSLFTNALFAGYCDRSTSFTIAFASAIGTLRRNGTAVFACSGNNASATTMGAPACVYDAFSVGAVYDANIGFFSFTGVCSDTTTAADQIACFSDSNSTLDLLGPGARIIASGRGGGLSTFSGTSQATPHAAGSAAILFSIRPSLTVDQVESLLKETGKLILDPRNGVTTPRVDILAAVEELLRPIPKRRHATAP